MNLETLLRETLGDWSEESPQPIGMADRVLRRRTRRRFLTASATVGAAALVTGAALVAVSVGAPDATPGPETSNALPLSGPGMNGTDLRTDTGNTPPKQFVAAGRVGLSAYYVWHLKKISADKEVRLRTWYLYDPGSGTYRKTPWANLDVAPGLRAAAVLEGPLPSARVGLLDMAKGKVVRWVRLSRPAAAVAWSPDGSRVLVTHYKDNPDVGGIETENGISEQQPVARTGFSVIDAQTGKTMYRELPAEQAHIVSSRQDLGWSRDGRLIWAPTSTTPARIFYDLNGTKRPTPKHESGDSEEAALSPDGRLLATNSTRNKEGPETMVVGGGKNKVLGYQPMEQLVVWADNTNLIGLECGKTCTGLKEFRNRFSLVSYDGKKIVPLTGFRENNQKPGSWEPIFTRR